MTNANSTGENSPGPSILRLGERVGPFEVVRRLGSGGMGEVFEARDSESGRRVALKVVNADLIASRKTRERFRREVELTRKIDHRHVLRTLDYLEIEVEVGGAGQRTKVPCLVLEFLEGETLADLLEHRGRLDQAQARLLVCQIAAALAAAHAAGVIHRDLKPDNVFLVADDKLGQRAVLTDFGVARSLVARRTARDESGDSQNLTASNLLLGTPDYMAPEQLELETANVATDLYALGLVAYQMVAGTLPFVSENRLQAVFQRVKQPPASPRQHVPDLDSTFEHVILRCLERDPEARYASANDLIRDLDAADSPWLVRPSLERRMIVALILGGLLGLVAIGLLVWFNARP